MIEIKNGNGRVIHSSHLRSFQGVDLSELDLRKAMFVNENLRSVNFSGADLRGAVFYRCDLSDAYFVHTDLSKTYLTNNYTLGAIFLDTGILVSGTRPISLNVLARIRLWQLGIRNPYKRLRDKTFRDACLLYVTLPTEEEQLANIQEIL